MARLNSQLLYEMESAWLICNEKVQLKHIPDSLIYIHGINKIKLIYSVDIYSIILAKISNRQ